MLSIGEDLGRYELIAHLKDGGMASLFLGRRLNPPDNRIFAIKAVHPHFLDDEQLTQMFRDEAGLSVRINHPNVVHVEEVGEARGLHFLAMEYIHGCSLAQLLQALVRRRRRMSPELATYVAMNVAEGLHAAHETRGPQGELLNVVHRDVSPQNILLSHTGDIKLIDFGIAISRMRVHHSQTGSAVKGKLRYMAPEHASGSTVDRRTDVYALGIVLWELLTMRPLFWSESDFGMLTQVRDPDVQPPITYAQNLSPALSDVVMRALAKNPDDRPASALEFRKQLAEAMPFADALDEEQVSELLHVMLGDEFNRKKNQLPGIVALEIEDAPSKELSPEVLDTLTSPSLGASLLERSLEDTESFEPVADTDDVRIQPPPAAQATSEYEQDYTDLMEPEHFTELFHQALGSSAPAKVPDTALESLPDLPGMATTKSTHPFPLELLEAQNAADDEPSYLPVFIALGVGAMILAGIGAALFL